MCAIMQKLRTFAAISVRCGFSALMLTLVRLVAYVADGHADDPRHDVDHENEKHDKGEVQATDRRDDSPDRIEERFDQHREIASPWTAQIRQPRKQRVNDQNARVDLEDEQDRPVKRAQEVHEERGSTEARLRPL